MKKLLFVLLLCAIPAWPRTKPQGAGHRTTRHALVRGWPQAGGYSSPAQGGGGTNFGASTVIVAGGAGGLSGTSGFGTTANRRYFVTANDTEMAALSITAAGIVVECPGPWVTIQQLTASTNLFTLGNGGNNFTARNCGVSPPASGTCAPLFGDTPATPVNNILLDNIELNANSSTCTDSGAGFVNISGGSHHSLDVWSPAASDDIVVLDTNTPATHNTISDVTIRTNHGNLTENSASAFAIRLRPFVGSGAGHIEKLNIDATVTGLGFYGGWGFPGQGPSFSTVTLRTTANIATSSALFSAGCFAHCNYTAIADDAGNFVQFAVVVLNDSHTTTLNAFVHATNGSTGIPVQLLDTVDSTINVYAAGDISSGLALPSNGWSTTSPCIQVASSASSGDNRNITLGNVQCYMPPGSTADGIDVSCTGTGSPLCDNVTVTSGVRLFGVSGAGSTGIKLINTASGGSQSFVNSTINGPWIRNFVTGISIGAAVNQTQVNGALITGATTPVSDSGTNSRIWTHRVQTTGTLAGGTLAVTFSGNDVWTSGTTYQCNGSDQTTVTNAVSFTYTSATAMTITGTTTDVIRYQCWGY